MNGQLTTLDQIPLITTETNAANGKSTASFAVERSFTALIALTGDQRAAVLKATASGQGFEQTMLPAISYDAASQTTYMRVSLFAGKWSLTTNTNCQIQVNELLFANESLNLNQLAALWSQNTGSLGYLIYSERAWKLRT